MSKTTFTELWFKNFMSFGNQKVVVDLTELGTALIIGENIDEGGSSGAGKTTLMNALSYVLYDKLPGEDVKKDQLINNINASKTVTMEVGLKVTIGADRYLIERRRGADAGVRLLKNDLDITPASVNRGDDSFDKKVEELIGFSFNLFSQIILFNGNSTAFLSLKGPQQRELIEELLRITLLSRKAEALKAQMNDTDVALKLQLALVEQQKKHAERHEQMIEAAKKRINDWNLQRDLEVSQQERKLEALLSIDFAAEEQLHTLISEIEAKIAPVDAEIRKLEADVRTERARRFPDASKIIVQRRELAAFDPALKKLESELAHLADAKCPYCLQKYEDADVKIADVRAQIEALTKSRDELSSQLQLLVDAEVLFETSQNNACNMVELDIQNLRNSKSYDVTELTELQAALTYKTYKDHVAAASLAGTLAEKIDRLKVEQNPHRDAYDALVNDPGVQVDMSKIDELSKLKEHQKVLHKLLTDKNSYIRKGIISKTLPFLNKRIAYYTERLGLPHVVLFQPDMTCEITKLGIELSHGNLSNGERKRLNLGLCFAFRDALTYLHSKVNLLLTDEVDGGSLDEQAVTAMIQLLKHKAWDDKISIFIISHRPEFDGRCDRNLVVRKEGGFSSLLKQPE